MRPKAGLGDRVALVTLALLKALCYLALFLGSQVAVMLPESIAAGLRMSMDGGADPDGLMQALASRAMLYSLLSNLFTLAVILAFYLIRREKLSDALWLRPVGRRALFAGAALMPAFYLAVTFALYALPEPWLGSYSEASAGIAGGGVLGLLAVAVAAPVVEEIIFRGLILTRLRAVMPGWLAVVLSAAIFGACHVHPVWFCYAFALGAFFGFLDLRSGSIWPSILAHLTFNAIGQVFGVLPEDGPAPYAVIGVTLALAIVLPILDCKGIAALFRRAPHPPAPPEPPAPPQTYDFDPWDM